VSVVKWAEAILERTLKKKQRKKPVAAGDQAPGAKRTGRKEGDSPDSEANVQENH